MLGSSGLNNGVVTFKADNENLMCNNTMRDSISSVTAILQNKTT
ncbi:hypothetical protein [Methanosarcina barkeri]|nr:hypothetical protein [Methanosarcina barkeri]